ncbi:hypothetical protein D3C81_2310050 [compost metagenome]
MVGPLKQTFGDVVREQLVSLNIVLGQKRIDDLKEILANGMQRGCVQHVLRGKPLQRML